MHQHATVANQYQRRVPAVMQGGADGGTNSPSHGGAAGSIEKSPSSVHAPGLSGKYPATAAVDETCSFTGQDMLQYSDHAARRNAGPFL